ncbi:hypothetical protein PGT21_028691 [Puccinia graminis f. sp. tritici]|uniref:Uncharacterized protein n=1 Tax=Puccinia graminis f. sp. tritici TaxID=56615 RepID=A0A5B0SE52_PUCGR|nr:hypothetical protein PGT21_029422 [Puccinia graminis f. sp. tritici]KAA1101731.1 hypothetical protein PGT21_028691 [Puccinia graminis f. sp. tritici]KAA1116885.1 hypothetical protein PGTUg99_028795 [Puccinia graminis f. sp. tritici]KAA1136248.1 hypothetical protein PGTUg99_012772 [Puccinia graminis f. sp. tritici]
MGGCQWPPPRNRRGFEGSGDYAAPPRGELADRGSEVAINSELGTITEQSSIYSFTDPR